ncbi:unnamed protein product [Adineta ricciae]|uniref:Uncharacterized protein n=1 Tax=Adineta ricciae TaxID=249248 RepID=A0A816D0G2_ADIRI|nr:unnamed protein product [Adineta ricciae]CAF1630721.1 unnamed protein product [Adineta ricciae]
MSATNFETDYYFYDYENNLLNLRPLIINEHELIDDLLNVLKKYADSKSNECYMETNLNDIDWDYINKLRSLLRGLVQTNLKHFYYRGLTLSSDNAILIFMRTDTCSEKTKINLMNIWKWSTFVNENEALLVVGTKPEDDTDSSENN